MELIHGAAPIARGYSPAEDYSFSLTPKTTTSSAGGVPGTLRDAGTLTIAGANTDSVFSVQLIDTRTDGTVVTNLTPGVATFTGSGVAQWVANGIALVQAVNATLGTRLLQQLVQRVVIGSSLVFNGYSAGALAADLSALVAGSLGGGASPATVARFSSLATNTRNAALWCGGLVDDTAITREPDTFTLNVLIGPHHILCASHVGAGGQLGWVGSNGVGYVGTIDGGATVAGTDIAVYYMRDATAPEIAAYNAAHPGSAPAAAALSVGIAAGVIKPFAMFPAATWAAAGAVALPLALAVDALVNDVDVPLFHTTRSNCVGLWDLSAPPASIVYNAAGGGYVTYPNEYQISQSSQAARAPFSAYANVGGTESGDISFTAIPAGSALAAGNAGLGAGYPVLLGVTHGSPDQKVFDVPWVALYVTQIQTLMQSTAQAAGDPLFATYAPVVLSLAGYATF